MSEALQEAFPGATVVHAPRWHDGPVLAFDVESTDRDPTVALPVSFALVHFDAREVINRRYGLIQPGIPIPPETTEIHGITDQDVQERGGELEKSVVGLAGELLAASFAEVPVVGTNLVYDLTLLDCCLRRLEGGEGLSDLGWRGPAVDALVLDRHVDRFRKGSRKLADLCKTYRVNPGRTHHAGADAEAAARVCFEIADRYPEVGDADLDLLFHLQRGWRKEWCQEFSTYLLGQGKEALPEDEADWPIKGLREVPL